MNRNIQYVDNLAWEKRAKACRRYRRIVVISVTIQDVLCITSARVARRAIPRTCSHIVPVSPSHLQSPLAAKRCISDITIARDVLKGMASPPLTWPYPAVFLQLIWLGEIVPGPQDLHREDSRRRLAVWQFQFWHVLIEEGMAKGLQHKSDECSRGHHA